MPIRYENISISLRASKIRTRIIDLDYSGSVGDMNLVDNGVVFKTNGDQRDIFKPMNLASCTLNVWIDTTDMMTLYNDMAAAEESRFYLEVDRFDGGVWRREFVGMILVDSLTRNDHTYPTFNMEAIDGMSILKEIESDEWTTLLIKPLWQILYECIKKNPVIENMYSDTDIIMVMTSQIQVDHPEYSSLWENVAYFDMFFTVTESIKTYWDCYRIIEEICNKFMLRIVYDDGAYYIRGIETYLDGIGISDTTITVNKTGTLGGGVTLAFSSWNVDNNALSGGQYTNIKGYRQVRIEASKEGSNKYLAENILIDSDTYTNTFIAFPPMLKNTNFELQIDINALITWFFLGDARPHHVMKVTVKFTDLSNNDVFYGFIFGNTIVDGDEPYLFRNQNTEAETLFFIPRWTSYNRVLKFSFPAYAEDRKLEIKFDFEFQRDFVPYPITFINEYNYKLSFKMGAAPLGSTSTSIPISSFVANTKNTGVYEKKIYASDMYGTIGTKALLVSPTTLDLIGNKWRIGSSGPFEGLEKVISAYMMKYLVNSQELLTLPVNTSVYSGLSTNTPTAFGEITYKGKTYIITTIDQDYLDDVVVVRGVKKNTPTTLPITSNALVTRRPPIGESAESASYSNAQIARVNTSWIIEDVNIAGTATEIDIPDSMYLPIDAFQDSVVKSLLVMVDGVAWTIVQGFNPADRRPRAVVNRSLHKIQFNRSLTNTIVKLVYQNNIIKDPDYTIA